MIKTKKFSFSQVILTLVCVINNFVFENFQRILLYPTRVPSNFCLISIISFIGSSSCVPLTLTTPLLFVTLYPLSLLFFTPSFQFQLICSNPPSLLVRSLHLLGTSWCNHFLIMHILLSIHVVLLFFSRSR